MACFLHRISYLSSWREVTSVKVSYLWLFLNQRILLWDFSHNHLSCKWIKKWCQWINSSSPGISRFRCGWQPSFQNYRRSWTTTGFQDRKHQGTLFDSLLVKESEITHLALEISYLFFNCQFFVSSHDSQLVKITFFMPFYNWLLQAHKPQLSWGQGQSSRLALTSYNLA